MQELTQRPIVFRQRFKIVAMPKYSPKYQCTIKPFSFLAVGASFIAEIDAMRQTGRGGNGHFAPKLKITGVHKGWVYDYEIHLTKLHGLIERGLRIVDYDLYPDD